MWGYNYEYLCHGIKGFKYIDKKKGSNGKWTYIYPGDEKRPTASYKKSDNTVPVTKTKPKSAYALKTGKEDSPKMGKIKDEYKRLRASLDKVTNQREREQIQSQIEAYKKKYGSDAENVIKQVDSNYDTLHSVLDSAKEKISKDKEKEAVVEKSNKIIQSYHDTVEKARAAQPGTQEYARLREELKQIEAEAREQYYDILKNFSDKASKPLNADNDRYVNNLQKVIYQLTAYQSYGESLTGGGHRR